MRPLECWLCSMVLSVAERDKREHASPIRPSSASAPYDRPQIGTVPFIQHG